MIYRREGMRHQCWSLVIVSTERGRQVGDEVLHHGLPRSRESPVYRRGHGESVFACASTLVRRGEYRAQTGIWRLLNFVSVRTIKGRTNDERNLSDSRVPRLSPIQNSTQLLFFKKYCQPPAGWSRCSPRSN
jgi:hypothetical protein